VKTEVLSKYVEACLSLYSIAFFQWKLIFAAEISYALESIIVERISKLNQDLESIEKVSKKGLK
jgi:hypothetical protein